MELEYCRIVECLGHQEGIQPIRWLARQVLWWMEVVVVVVASSSDWHLKVSSLKVDLVRVVVVLLLCRNYLLSQGLGVIRVT